MNIINEIKQEKLIGILRGINKNKLLNLASALYKGGIRFLEIPFDASKKVSDEEIASSIRMLSKEFEGKIQIGAGTVLSPNQVLLTKENGGKYIIAPNVDRDVAKATKDNGLIYMPGALTPTEVQNAHLLGADFVKLFPIANLGASYVKAIMAPLSHIDYLAVGGITLENIPDYKKVGVCGFGIGSNIAPKNLLEADNYEEIEKLAKAYVEVVK